MKTNEEIRENAKAQLGSLFQDRWVMSAILCVISSAVMGLLTNYTYVGELVLTGPLNAAMMVAFLSLKRSGTVPDIGEFFREMFSSRLAKYFVVYFVSSLVSTLLTLLLIVPGIVRHYEYAMCLYIVKRNPEIELKDCLTESRAVMKGRKMQLFLLDLSFFGRLLLGALCLGIGVFWAEAYWNTARANFYDEAYARYTEGVCQ